MSFSPKIAELIQALRCLPGVGPKTAQRMTLHILQRDRDNARLLAHTMLRAIECVQQCEQCRNLSETPICHLCSNPARDPTCLCIVESPTDVFAIEQTGAFRGQYFVLLGHLSPLDGMGPQEIGIPKLLQRLKQNIIREVIIATNPTVEGEATAHYLAETVKHYGIQASRIAHGIPLGGELEYIDSNTIARALASREPL